MTALYLPKNAKNKTTAIESYDLIRTCLNDKEEADQKMCVDKKDSYCFSCEGANCNNHLVPEDRLTCFHCNGNDCQEPVSMKCQRYMSDDACYARFDDSNSLIEMGCLSELRGEYLENLLITKKMDICTLDNCNHPDKLPLAQQCAVCDSKKDVDCAVNPNEITEVKTCNVLPQTQCYTRLNIGKLITKLT